MSSADLVHELRAARPTTPEGLRRRVEEIAASSPEPRAARLAAGWLSRRRVLAVVPVAASLAVASAAGFGLVDGWRSPAASREAVTIVEPLPPATATKTLGDTAVTELPADPAFGTYAPSSSEQQRAAGAVGIDGGNSAPGPDAARAQRVFANLTLQVKDTDALSGATQRALDLVRSLGGHVVTVSYATGTEGSAAMTLRVPTGKVQDAITRLSGLGTILQQQVQIDDLQQSLDATSKRIETVRGQIAAITERLRSTTLDDQTRVTLVERRNRLQSELRTLRQSRASLNAEASFATIQLQLLTERSDSIVPVASSGFDRALDRMVEILSWEAIVALTIAAMLAPVALVAGAVWFSLRMLRRRGADQLLASNS